jgi:hypothetical protein
MVPRNNQRQLHIFCLLLAFSYGGPFLCSGQSANTPSELQPARSLAIEQQDSGAPASQTSSVPSSGNGPKNESKEEKKAKKKDKSHIGSFVIAPLPIVSPAIGSGLVPVVGYITPIPPSDRTETPSTFGAGGLITDNGSHAFFVGTDMYLSHARYEVESGYFNGSLDYNLYGEGFVNGNAGLKLPLEQTGEAFFIKFLVRIPWDTYVGGRFFTGNSLLTVKSTSGDLPPIPPDVGEHTNLRSLGAEVSRDTRPNRFYPLKGTLLDFTADVFGHALGSKYSFQSYKFTFNKYVSIPGNQVLAYNLYYCGTGGSAPFYGECIYGANNELRGYTAGRYIDRQMFATQLEDRLALPWRLGIVGFGGIGAVAPGTTQWRSNEFLPAGGTGLRFMLSKSYHVNLRTDFAWGRGNFTWAVGVGEAF